MSDQCRCNQIITLGLFFMFGTFPILPKRNYNNDDKTFKSAIQNMYQSYHNPLLTHMQDEIIFNEQSEFLKRQYASFQFPNKIIMLSEYYQYHKELPRIFQNEIIKIIQIYQEEVRNMEYQYVTKKMKEDHGDIFTEREKRKPIDKIIKNIQLSYYNFQKKEIKRNKESDRLKQTNINKHKKSMPMLPLYQNNQKKIGRPVPPHPPKNVVLSTNVEPLRLKDMNKLSIKSKSKEHLKKVSLNNSLNSPKPLSRSKSKSNLVMLQDPLGKRVSVKPFHEIPGVQKMEKTKSNPTSLQKAASQKYLPKKDEQKKSVRGIQKLDDKKQTGVKNMFKKVMQAKKIIKIAR